MRSSQENEEQGLVGRSKALLRWRTLLLILTFACGLVGFLLGAGVSDRAGVESSGIATKLYYTLGLFVLGGMDLGVPDRGPLVARIMLWIAYFAAPAITASALIESLLRVLRPEVLFWRRLKGHIVIAGCGRLTLLVLERLRQTQPDAIIVVIEVRQQCVNVDEARDAYGAEIIFADITSDALLGTLRLDRADRVFLLTGNDFANLDAATKIRNLAPKLAAKTFVHVADLGFMRAMAKTKIARTCVPFNSHQVAARHVVDTKLLDHFTRTEGLDTVILGGFGRFGQTLLDELQNRAVDKFDTVVIVDTHGSRNSLQFADEVGFADGYQRHIVDGDIQDLEVWHRIEKQVDFDDVAPAFILGSANDSVNLHAALRLRSKYPTAFIVARSFSLSTFGRDVAEEAGFYPLSVAELISQSMPDEWFGQSTVSVLSRAAPSLFGPSRPSRQGIFKRR